jgi:probable HAF family extracellular repeat protein
MTVQRTATLSLLLLAGCVNVDGEQTITTPHQFARQSTPRVAMQELGTLGGPRSGALGVNKFGAVVGWSEDTSGNQHAFMWSRGAMTDLGTLGGGYSVAYDVNADGTVVGISSLPSGQLRAFVWMEGQMWDLGLFPGTTESWARGISEDGVIIGASVNNYGDSYAVIWADGEIRDLGNLGSLGGGNDGWAINRWGQAVGRSGSGASVFAFLWQDGEMTNLGALGGTFSLAYDANDKGQVVGEVRPPGPSVVQRAFLWEDGSMITLGTLGGDFSTAFGVNLHGEVVGQSRTAAGPMHAFMWRAGSMIDLGPGSAWDINDRRQVVGQSANGIAVLWEVK